MLSIAGQHWLWERMFLGDWCLLGEVWCVVVRHWWMRFLENHVCCRMLMLVWEFRWVCENDGSSCPLLYIVALWKPSNPQKRPQSVYRAQASTTETKHQHFCECGFPNLSTACYCPPFQTAILKIPNTTAFGLLYLDQTIKNVSRMSGHTVEV